MPLKCWQTITNMLTGYRRLIHLFWVFDEWGREEKVRTLLVRKVGFKPFVDKPKAIKTFNKTTSTNKAQVKEQSPQSAKLVNLIGINLKATVNKSPGTNWNRAYMYQYNLADVKNFKHGLLNDCELVEVIEPTWIKPRANQKAKPLLLYFGEEVPLFIDIPEALMRSRVYEYKRRGCIESATV